MSTSSDAPSQDHPHLMTYALFRCMEGVDTCARTTWEKGPQLFGGETISPPARILCPRSIVSIGGEGAPLLTIRELRYPVPPAPSPGPRGRGWGRRGPLAQGANPRRAWRRGGARGGTTQLQHPTLMVVGWALWPWVAGGETRSKFWGSQQPAPKQIDTSKSL